MHIFQGFKPDLEANGLLVGAIIASVLLLFILLEPLFTQSVAHQSIYRVFLQEASPGQNERNFASKSPLEPDRIAPLNQKAATPKPEVPIPHSQTPQLPEQFAFGVQPNIDQPESVPFLGGARSGMRPQNANPQAPKPNHDLASNVARQTANIQFGNEITRQQAQSEIPVFVHALEPIERYRCTVENGGQAHCNPQNKKSKYLESILIRFYGNAQCMQVELSQEIGILANPCR